MKKILFLFTLLFSIAFLGNAQGNLGTAKGDTLTNADTVFVNTGTTLQSLVGIQAVVTKVSGTVAGNGLLQGTIDGSNWVTASSDTLTLTNVAVNSRVWPITTNAYRQYRLRIITTGTQVSIPSIAWLRRQP